MVDFLQTAWLAGGGGGWEGDLYVCIAFKDDMTVILLHDVSFAIYGFQSKKRKMKTLYNTHIDI